ncbi:MAG: hypothetical protein A2W23_08245 [Planctomycetes bacterium RBG_16_43_13]|nr:MAG: hypothetical protein A2W23_08245 [Planctomycetes bacterium RBG_16_43_13]
MLVSNRALVYNIIIMETLKPLFWEYDWGSVQGNLNSPFIIARVMELANPQQFHTFAQLVGVEAMRLFLKERGRKLLSPQSYNFWALYYRVNDSVTAA